MKGLGRVKEFKDASKGDDGVNEEESTITEDRDKVVPCTNNCRHKTGIVAGQTVSSIDEKYFKY